MKYLNVIKKRFSKFSLKKKLLVTILSFLFAIVLIVLVFNFFKKPSYKTAVVSKGDVVELVSETGKVVSSGTVEVFSPTNGIVRKVNVKNGDSVFVGKELFTVESSATEQEQKAASANYLAAKATLASAESSLYALESAKFSAWDTFKQLAESDKYEDTNGKAKEDQRILPEFHIAKNNWLAAEAKVKDQQTVISQAKALVSSTWLLYQATQDAVVKASIAGTVSNISIVEGNGVSINSALAPTAPVLLLSTPSPAEVVVGLGESDILKIQVGQKAKIEVDAIESKEFEGTVTRYDSVGTDTQGIIKYNVYVKIEEDNGLIRSGMEADVVIETNRLSGVLAVANSAVKPFQGGKAVRIPAKKKGEVEFIPVKVGVKGDEKTEILEGLTEGQTIVVSLANEDIKRSSPFGF